MSKPLGIFTKLGDLNMFELQAVRQQFLGNLHVFWEFLTFREGGDPVNTCFSIFSSFQARKRGRVKGSSNALFVILDFIRSPDNS